MTLGVIGGLGPMATARFMEMVIEMTEAVRDQDHIEMIIHNCPRIPDRTAYILGQSDETPADLMVEIGQSLTGQGVCCIAIPCITAHYFYRELSEKISVPIINIIDETAGELVEHGVERVGILATDGTVKSGLFQNRFEELGLEALVPDDSKSPVILL